MSNARDINRRRRSHLDLKFEIRSDPSQSSHFRPPEAISAQNRRFASPRPCVESISTPTQSKSIQPNPMKQLVSTTSGSNPFRPLKNPFSTPIYPCFHDGSLKPFQGKSRCFKAFKAYFPARLSHPSLRPTPLRHPSSMCASGARIRIPRGPSREKCAFRCGNVR